MRPKNAWTQGLCSQCNYKQAATILSRADAFAPDKNILTLIFPCYIESSKGIFLRLRDVFLQWRSNLFKNRERWSSVKDKRHTAPFGGLYKPFEGDETAAAQVAGQWLHGFPLAEAAEAASPFHPESGTNTQSPRVFNSYILLNTR